MKVFVDHLIVMGILKKNSLEQYWSRDSILNMPFFGHYMSRNCFQNVLWDLHVTNPDETNPPKGEADHDPLFCLGQWWTWCKGISVQSTGQERNYLWMKACVLLRAESISSVTTPKSQTGSILNFLWSVNLALATFLALKFIQEMHLGQSQGNVQEVQDASKTSCTVLGLLDSVQLLDMGHHVYFDNYYNSPDLIDLLYKRKTHACGTVRKNQKSLPLAVTQAKLKQGETVFHHKNNLLALKWMDKRKCTF